MEVLPIKAEYLIEGLKYCQFSSKLIIPLSKKLEVYPLLLARHLLDQIELMNFNNSESGKKI